jgi:hypothetical protein
MPDGATEMERLRARVAELEAGIREHKIETDKAMVLPTALDVQLWSLVEPKP